MISGDTRYSANLVEHATGSDVVIHEVMAVPEQRLVQSEVIRRIMNHHTSPEDAGRVFTESGARLAVYSHVIGANSESGLSELIRRTRTTYAGELEVGRDLMTIDVSDTLSVRQRTPEQP